MNLMLTNWQRRVIDLGIALMLFQFIYLIEQKTLDTNLVSFLSWMLVLTLIGEMLMSEPTYIKRLLFQIPFLALNYFATAKYVASSPSIEPKSMLYYLDMVQNMGNVDSVLLHIGSLWYGLVIVLAFWLMSDFFVTKQRIIVVSTLVILIFAVLDSFSRYELDSEVAMALFSALLLTMMSHFNKLMDEQERIWQAMSKNPAKLLLSLAIIAGVILMANKYTWETDPLLEDPWTMWKNYKNRAAGTGVSGPGSAGGNKTPEEATANYGFEEFELGSGFDFDATPIMQVTSNYEQYYRGQTKSVYNGKGWESSGKEKNTTMTGFQPDAVLGPYDWVNMKLMKTVDVVQNIRQIEPLNYPVYFGAYPIRQFISADGEAAKVPNVATWSQYNEEVRYNVKLNKGYPTEYSLVSKVQIIDEEALKKVTPEFMDLEKFKSNAWLKDYYQLPDTLPQRVKDKAVELTKDKATLYEKAKAIEQYLYKNFKYNNHPDKTKAISKDFVDAFLFEMKEGYCDYYSTAMVVMVRSIGMPARWVQGYTQGAGTDDVASGATGGQVRTAKEGVEDTYTIRNSDSHSWVEIFFEGYGWIAFEPTSGFLMPQLNKVKKEVVQEQTVVQQQKQENKESKVWEEIKQILLYTFVTILVVGGALAFWKRRQILFFLKVTFKARQMKTVNEKILFEFEKMLYYASLSGFYHSSSETLREIIREWIIQKNYTKQDMEALLPLLERAAYSSDVLKTEDVNIVTSTVDKYRKGI